MASVDNLIKIVKAREKRKDHRGGVFRRIVVSETVGNACHQKAVCGGYGRTMGHKVPKSKNQIFYEPYLTS